MRGRLPASRGEILVSDDLARHLGIEPGASATLISSTMYGGMATSNFTIAGTVRFGIRAMDRGTILADIGDVQAALDMQDAAGEILGFFPDTLYRRDVADSIAARFNARWEKTDDEFAPTVVAMHRQPGIAELMDYMGLVSTGIVVIFTLVMSIVLWNAGLIGSLRRYGEIGLRLAFGEDKGHLYRAMIVESLVIGLVGSVVGTLLAMMPCLLAAVARLRCGLVDAELVADAEQRHPGADHRDHLRHRLSSRSCWRPSSARPFPASASTSVRRRH